VRRQLDRLSGAELRKVRSYERKNKQRRGVLEAIEKTLQGLSSSRGRGGKKTARAA
jgi:hypothetical protein